MYSSTINLICRCSKDKLKRISKNFSSWTLMNLAIKWTLENSKRIFSKAKFFWRSKKDQLFKTHLILFAGTYTRSLSRDNRKPSKNWLPFIFSKTSPKMFLMRKFWKCFKIRWTKTISSAWTSLIRKRYFMNTMCCCKTLWSSSK